MPRGNPSPKLSVTIPPDVAQAVATAAAHEGVSVSTWLTEAARRQLKLADARKGVAAIEKLHGEPSAAAVAWARGALSAAGSTKRRRRA